MKILFTGGGTGGHFYPIIAVAEKVNEIIDKEKVLDAKLYYMSDSPYDKGLLFENSIKYVEVTSGKQRLYSSTKNVTDIFKIAYGCLSALYKVFLIYPDVVFGKGGYASFPALFAARILGIPVIIHESDSVPGKVNLWASKFAKKIAISYAEAVEYFPKEKTALTGQPIRSNIVERAKEGTFEYLKLDPTIPVIFIWGGSLGAVTINDVVIDALPELLTRYQIIHQVGPKNLNEIQNRIAVALDKNDFKDRYKLFGYLNTLAVKMSAGAASLIITRAGSSLFEIASWGVPSIVVPIPEAVSHDQKHNAFNYARSGACTVIEENNFTPSIMVAEIDRIVGDKQKWETMSRCALAFAHPGAAEQIAKELVGIALKHEK